MTQETVQQYCEHLGNIVNCKIFVKDDRPLGKQESLEGLLDEGGGRKNDGKEVDMWK